MNGAVRGTLVGLRLLPAFELQIERFDISRNSHALHTCSSNKLPPWSEERARTHGSAFQYVPFWRMSGSGSLSLSLVSSFLLGLVFRLGVDGSVGFLASSSGDLIRFSLRVGCRFCLSPCHSLHPNRPEPTQLDQPPPPPLAIAEGTSHQLPQERRGVSTSWGCQVVS